MIRVLQQARQGQNTWIQVQEIAAAGHLDAVTLSVSTEYARFGVGCQLLKQRKLTGGKLGSKRLQNGAEILIEHRGEIRVIIAWQERTETRRSARAMCHWRGFARRQGEARVRAQRSYSRRRRCSRTRSNGGSSDGLRLDRIERSATDLCLTKRQAGPI